MGVAAGGGDVLDVIMLGVRRHRANPLLRFLLHAEGVADVEIQPDPRRSDPPGELQVLLERLDHQARLRLDQEQHAQLLGHLDAGHELFIEHVGGGVPRLALSQRSARLGLDRRRPKFLGQPQRPLRVLAADGPVVRVGLDPGGMPIRLPRIGHGVHHKAVDVRDRQPVFFQAFADRPLSSLQQSRRPGMRHVGQQFHARIAQRGDTSDGLFDREVLVGVGTVGETHD